MAIVTTVEGADVGAIAHSLTLALSKALDSAEGPIAIAVPGGSSPFPIMERLVKADLDWPRVVVWPGDDRVVPEDHEASNSGKIRALFEPVGAAVAPLTVMEDTPRFALVWLGMGADGHIASLFPNTDPKADDPASVRQLTPDPLPPEAPFDRVTLTIPALLNSDAIFFTLAGSEEKREVFEAAMRHEHDLPVARLMGAATQQITCFL